jgi:PAS domain-containing protein
MLPDRAAFLSSRIFWAITLVFCAIEAAILATAYDHGADEDRLAAQLALTHQASGVAWRLASTSIAAEADPQLAWLESILVGLNHGGPVHTLDNSLVQLGAIKPPDARHVLTDAVARLGSARRLHNVVPGSPLVQDEIRGLVPALAQLGTVLASRRDEADHTAAVLVGIALVTTAGGFIAAGLLLLRQSRRLERSGRLMRSMMNQIGAGVCIIGSTDKIADANRAACRMLGRPRRSSAASASKTSSPRKRACGSASAPTACRWPSSASPAPSRANAARCASSPSSTSPPATSPPNACSTWPTTTRSPACPTAATSRAASRKSSPAAARTA